MGEAHPLWLLETAPELVEDAGLLQDDALADPEDEELNELPDALEVELEMSEDPEVDAELKRSVDPEKLDKLEDDAVTLDEDVEIEDGVEVERALDEVEEAEESDVVEDPPEE